MLVCALWKGGPPHPSLVLDTLPPRHPFQNHDLSLRPSVLLPPISFYPSFFHRVAIPLIGFITKQEISNQYLQLDTIRLYSFLDVPSLPGLR
jgi:hypothetical protein